MLISIPLRNLDQNPWLELPGAAPFVLDTDRPIIDDFNYRAKGRTPAYRVETSLLPEPWVGWVDAPILLLLLNPGVSDEDLVLHQQTDFRRRVLACHRQAPSEYPNYYLDPALTGPGARWSRRVLAFLIRDVGAASVAENVAYLEFFPYHSRRFAHHRLRVPSQDYTFGLLREAIRRETVIFVTRGRVVWEEVVPELAGYRRAFTTRSRQNVVITPRNCPEGYPLAAQVMEALLGH